METLNGIYDPSVEKWILELRLNDGIRRQRARKHLEELGAAAMPLLLETIKSENLNARWEAIKALHVIRDPSAIPLLLKKLRDPVFEIRWLAAEALIQLGFDYVSLPLLEALKKNTHSKFLRDAVHHILRVFQERKDLNQECLSLLRAVWSVEPELELYKAVNNAIQSLKSSSMQVHEPVRRLHQAV